MAWTRSDNDGFSWHRRYPGPKLVFEVKNNSFIAQANNNSINTLIIFLAEGSSQLREWLRDCVRDCWQPVWKIFQLWWIGRLLISRWVFVVSRLNYPALTARHAYLPSPEWTNERARWRAGTNQRPQMWQAQSIQNSAESFWTSSLCTVLSPVKSTSVGCWHGLHIIS